MNDAHVVCPRCQKEVTLVMCGKVPTCPECGTVFRYRVHPIAPPPLPEPRYQGDGPGTFAQISMAFFKVVCILVAIFVVGLAVLFAGCALAFRY